MADDLRTLAQAVVDAGARFRANRQDQEAYYALVDATRALGLRASEAAIEVAASLLAALDAADAQGYARAMGEVVAEAERDEALRASPGPHPNAVRTLQDIAYWARERAAAVEKERG